MHIYFYYIQLQCLEVTRRPKKRATLYGTDTEDNYSESMMPPRGLRNTDKSLYWISQKAQVCPLCRKRCKGRMVSHFSTDHKGSEVFVARISPKMVDLVNNGKRSFKTEKRYHNSTIHTMCVFCEDEKNFPPSYWVDHMRSHSGT